MKKVIFITLTVLTVIVLFYFIFLRNWRENDLKNQGDQLIDKIERYRDEKGVLPNHLADIGVAETADYPLYYQKKDSINYIIWFGTSLGESVTFYSDSKQWEEHYRKIGK